MDAFTVGVLVLLAMSAVFYVVLFSFIYYWHLKKVSYIIVPLLFTFEFFVAGFFVVSIVSIIIQFLPRLVGS
jgi:ABC-type multidrug transport system permease subunit